MILAVTPIIPAVTIPLALQLPEPSMISFGVVSTFDEYKFVANKQWFLKANEAIESIKLKGIVDTLTMNQDCIDALNAKVLRYGRTVLLRLPSFVSTRVRGKTELYPGTHWHWDFLTSKLSTIAVLYILSGQVCDSLESRGAHESYLQHDSNKYLKFEDELEKADGVYLFKDDTRGTIIRAGMSENECKIRYDQHNKMSFLTGAPDKHRQLYLSYPHETVTNQVEGRKGKFLTCLNWLVLGC